MRYYRLDWFYSNPTYYPSDSLKQGDSYSKLALGFMKCNSMNDPDFLPQTAFERKFDFDAVPKHDEFAFDVDCRNNCYIYFEGEVNCKIKQYTNITSTCSYENYLWGSSSYIYKQNHEGACDKEESYDWVYILFGIGLGLSMIALIIFLIYLCKKRRAKRKINDKLLCNFDPTKNLSIGPPLENNPGDNDDPYSSKQSDIKGSKFGLSKKGSKIKHDDTSPRIENPETIQLNDSKEISGVIVPAMPNDLNDTTPGSIKKKKDPFDQNNFDFDDELNELGPNLKNDRKKPVNPFIDSDESSQDLDNQIENLGIEPINIFNNNAPGGLWNFLNVPGVNNNGTIKPMNGNIDDNNGFPLDLNGNFIVPIPTGPYICRLGYKAKTKEGIWIIPDRQDPKYNDEGYFNKIGYWVVPNTNNINYCLLSVKDPLGKWVVPNLNDPNYNVNGYKDLRGNQIYPNPEDPQYDIDLFKPKDTLGHYIIPNPNDPKNWNLKGFRVKDRHGNYIKPDIKDPDEQKLGVRTRADSFIIPNPDDKVYNIKAMKDRNGNWIVPNMNDPNYNNGGYKNLDSYYIEPNPNEVRYDIQGYIAKDDKNDPIVPNPNDPNIASGLKGFKLKNPSGHAIYPNMLDTDYSILGYKDYNENFIVPNAQDPKGYNIKSYKDKTGHWVVPNINDPNFSLNGYKDSKGYWIMPSPDEPNYKIKDLEPFDLIGNKITPNPNQVTPGNSKGYKAKDPKGNWIIPNKSDPNYNVKGYSDKDGYWVVPNPDNVQYPLLLVKNNNGSYIVPNLNDPNYNTLGYTDRGGNQIVPNPNDGTYNITGYKIKDMHDIWIVPNPKDPLYDEVNYRDKHGNWITPNPNDVKYDPEYNLKGYKVKDTKGNWIIPNKKDPNYNVKGYTDRHGNWIMPSPDNELYPVRGYKNPEGKWIVPPNQNDPNFSDNSEFIDNTGNWILPDPNNNNSNGQRDLEGNWVIPDNNDKNYNNNGYR